MVQLIIDNRIYLPETSRGKYKCYPALLGEQLDMISGRRVYEVRGTVQMIEYAYDYMGNALLRSLLEVLRSGRSFPVSYLPDGGDTLTVGTFLTQSLTDPVFAFSRSGKPYWHDIAFQLREVSPHA